MSTSIESPLLRKIALLYGSTGIQLYPYSVRHLRGCGNLTVNLLLNLAIFHNMITGREFASERLIERLHSAKPFFMIVYKLFVSRFYPLCTLLTMLHYFLYGPAMMACLDSPSLRPPFEGKAGRYFSALVVANFAMFVAVNTSNISSYYRGKEEEEEEAFTAYETLYNCILLYFLSSIRYFQTTVLHYCLHGTHRRLLTLHEQLISAQNEKSEQEQEVIKSALISQFIDLALVNKQIYHLVSLQMITFYCLSSLNVLIISYIALLIANMYIILIFPLANILYILYLIGLNRKVQALAAMMVKELKKSKKGASKDVQIKVVHHFLQSPSSVHSPSRAIRYEEIEIYQRCFTLKAFDLTKLNRKFMLATGLLILNYTIFIYQTQ